MKISKKHHIRKKGRGAGKIRNNPFAGRIDKISMRNKYFRKVVFTGKKEQLVVMSIPPGGDIGNEVHHKVDQFIRVEGGKAKFIFNNGKKVFYAGDGGAVVVPAGTWHNVINTGSRALKLYTVYAPPNHPAGTIDKTKKDAIIREGHKEMAQFINQAPNFGKEVTYATGDDKYHRLTNPESIKELLNSGLEAFVHFKDGTMELLTDLRGKTITIGEELYKVQ
jgi:mannose-6-phosphate isomerase-like protein (cupin superfamily)